MEEIKAGEYVRTKEGIIDRVIVDYKGKCNNETCSQKHVSCQYNYYNENKIIKHSKNILDLIETGDFVNGKRCLEIEYYPQENGDININFVCLGGSVISMVDGVHSIVTKEQFAQMEYKVED